jgi:hypothetical protein
VDAGIDGDLDLGPDPVIGGHQDRIRESCGLQVEQPAKTADLGICPRAARGTHQRLDRVDHGIARIDIDAGIGIGQAICLAGFARAHGQRTPVAGGAIEACRFRGKSANVSPGHNRPESWGGNRAICFQFG